MSMELITKRGIGISEEEYKSYNVEIPCPYCKLKHTINLLDCETDEPLIHCDVVNRNFHIKVLKYVPEILLKKYKFLTTNDKDRRLYIYDEKLGIWNDEKAENTIMKECKLIFNEFTTQKLNNVVLNIQALTLHERDFNNAIYKDEKGNIYFNLKNGILKYNPKTKEKEFLQHNPDFHFLSYFNITYKPTKEFPNKILRLLLFYTKNLIDFANALESFAFVLIPRYEIKKMVIVVGKKNSGKTTFTYLLHDFLNRENISSLTLQTISNPENRFQLAYLYGKIANICDDLPDEVLSYMGTIKMLTGESPITAERKFGSPFNFINYAKMIFTTNQIPQGKIEEASLSRFKIVEFKANLENEKKNYSHQDILNLVFDEEEKNKFFNFLLDYVYPNLLEKNDFTISEDIEKIEERYLKFGNNALYFFREMLIDDKEASIPKNELWNTYVEWCRRYNYFPKTEKVFWNSFYREMQGRYDIIRKEIDGKRIRTIVGLRLKTFEELEMEKIENELTIEANVIKQVLTYLPNDLEENEKIKEIKQKVETEKYLKISELEIEIPNPLNPIPKIISYIDDEKTINKIVKEALSKLSILGKEEKTYNFVKDFCLKKYNLDNISKERIDKVIDEEFQNGNLIINPSNHLYNWKGE